MLWLVIACATQVPAPGAPRLLRGGDPPAPGCTPPAEVLAHVSTHRLSFLAASGTAVVYGSDDADAIEVSMLVYDCIKQQKLLFLHIPKNAGTTIEHLGVAGESAVWGEFFLGDRADKTEMPDGSTCSAWHTPPEFLPPPNPYLGAEVFCVTRDPWDRMVSEYAYVIAAVRDHKLHTGTWISGSAMRMERMVDDPDCSVAKLNEYVIEILAEMENKSRFVGDCHMLPQWDYVKGTQGKKWCDHVLPITDLTTKFNALMMSKELPVRMAAHHKANDNSDTCANLRAMKPAVSFHEKAQAAMERVYWEDFAHLGNSLSGGAPGWSRGKNVSWTPP